MSKRYTALRVVDPLTFPHFVIEEKEVEADDSGRLFLREGSPKYRVCLGGMVFPLSGSMDAALFEAARLNELYEQNFQLPEHFSWSYRWIDVVGTSAVITTEHLRMVGGRVSVRKSYASLIGGTHAPAESISDARNAIKAEEDRVEKARLEKIEQERADRLRFRPPGT